MADGREQLSLLTKVSVRFDISTFVRWQAGKFRIVDIQGTSAACTNDVNTLKSRDFEKLL